MDIPAPNKDEEHIDTGKIEEINNAILDQSIEEANDEDDKIASTALIFLEHLAISMEIYESNNLLSFLRKSIYDDNKIVYLRYYLDLIRRMLHTSTTLRKDDSFQDYVRKDLKKRLTDIISSFDSKYSNAKSSAFQIFDEFQIISSDDRNIFYIHTLIECVQNCDDDQYQKNLQYLVTRIIYNNSIIGNIRKQLISVKRSATSDHVRKRCDDLLQFYK
jgi:hypothetical protein